MKATQQIAQNPLAVAATESEINTIFKQMVENLTSGLLPYGKDETSAMWAFHTALGLIHGQALNHSKGHEAGQLLIWILTETRPYTLENYQPKNRSLAEYAYQLLYDLLDNIGSCLPDNITIDKYQSMFDHLDNTLDQLGELLITTNELSYVDLHERLGVLTTIRKAINPEAVLDKVLVGQSSQEV